MEQTPYEIMIQRQNELMAWTIYVAIKNGFEPYACYDLDSDPCYDFETDPCYDFETDPCYDYFVIGEDGFDYLYVKASSFLVNQAEEDGSLVFEEAEEASSEKVSHRVKDFDLRYEYRACQDPYRHYDENFKRVSKKTPDGIYGAVLLYANKKEEVVAVYVDLEKIGRKKRN